MGFSLSKLFDFFKDKTPDSVKKGNALLSELRRPVNSGGYYREAYEDLDKPIPIDLEKVRRLIAEGADLTVTNFSGDTALCLAITNKGLEDVAQELINAGADVDHMSTLGQSPLMLAAENGLARLVKGLLEKKADARLANSDGDTALHSACKGGNVDIVKKLIAAGADIDKQGKWGQTPLMTAAEYRHIDIVKLLVEEGARRDLSNENNRTIYDLVLPSDGSGIKSYLNTLQEKDLVAKKEAKKEQVLTERNQLDQYLQQGAPLDETVKPVPSIRFKPKEPKK